MLTKSSSIERIAQFGFDSPQSFDWKLLNKHLEWLSKGRLVEMPLYNYKTHRRTQNTIRTKPSRIILVEGLFLYNIPEIRDLFQLKIYVDLPIELCLQRRLERDTQERGRSKESVRSQWHRDVLPMFLEYVQPNFHLADLIYPGRAAEKDLNNLNKNIANLL